MAVPLTACDGDSGGSAISTSQRASALAGSFWSYERFELVNDGARQIQEADSFYFGQDGRYERYSGFEPLAEGTWSVNQSGDLELVQDDTPGGAPQTFDVEDVSDEALTLRVPNPLDPASDRVERRYTPSQRCPLYLSRSGGRYASFFLDILTPATQRAGWVAADFDSDGELHVIAARFAQQQEGFYATTRGARCGLQLFEFEAESAARMVIGPDDTIHVAYTEGTAIRYASRSATAETDVPWDVVEVSENTFAAPELSLALAPNGSVAIAAGGDDGDYQVFRSEDPSAASPDWQRSTLPVTRQAGQELIFGVSAAFDPKSRLHVATTPNGTDVTVFRDDESEWSPLPLPTVPIPAAFEGPSSFAIADDGTWWLAAGSIGTPNSDFGPGRAGPLYLGSGDGNGNGSDEMAFTWNLVSAGGRAVLDLAEDGAVHLASIDRMLGGLHTVVRDDTVKRYQGNVTLSTFDRTALATGPAGRVAIGNNDSVQVLPEDGALEAITVPVVVELTDPEGSSVAFPELDEECDESCTLEMSKGRWVQWTPENAADRTPRAGVGSACLGAELTGHCWLLAEDPLCTGSVCPPQLAITFAEADVSAILDPRVAELETGSWTPYGPVASDGGLALALTLVGTSTPSQIVRWDPDSRAFTSQGIAGWSRVDGLVEQADGGLVLFGITDGSTSLAGRMNFTGERVAAGLDRAGNVSWVTPLDETALPTGMVPLADGFAVGSPTGLFRYTEGGEALPTVDAGGIVAFTAARLLGGGTTADIVGPVAYDSANGPSPLSAWLRFDADGALAGNTELPGTLVAAARNADSSVVMALILSAGQEWDGASVAEDSWALARYDAEGELLASGEPQLALAGLGEPTDWARLMAAGVALRQDGVLVIVIELAPQRAQVLELGMTSANQGVELGGTGFGGAVRSFTFSGVAAAGSAAYVGGLANGLFGFVGAEQSFDAPTPALFEIP